MAVLNDNHFFDLTIHQSTKEQQKNTTKNRSKNYSRSINSSHSNINFTTNRMIHIIFLIMLVFTFNIATGDLTEPFDCSGVTCPMECPYDSSLVVVSLPNIKEVYTSPVEPDATTSFPPLLNGISDATEQQTIGDQIAVETKVKRAVESYPQETIKIVPGGVIRQKRNTDNENTVIPSINYQMIDDKRIAECCAGHRCECDYSKCKQICGPNQRKYLERPRSNKPGDCCPIYSCSEEERHDISCYSKNHKRHYSVNATWNEDDCTQCVCSDNGEPKCRISVCKPKSCEKKIQRPGECCPECDYSDTKYCVGHEECDIHCRHGLQVLPGTNCTICKCAKATTTPTTIASNGNSSIEEKAANATENSMLIYVPIFAVICICILLLSCVLCLTCRYISNHKDKHRLNLKHNNNLTPLI